MISQSINRKHDQYFFAGVRCFRNHMVAAGLFLCASLAATPVSSEALEKPVAEYSPAVASSKPTRVFWGDTHLHTNLSADAFFGGNQSMSPDLAYRFARGETVVTQGGIKARLDRPLDFLMIADHAEFLGVLPKIFQRSDDIVNSTLGKRWIQYIDDKQIFRVLQEFAMLSMGIGNAEDQTRYVDESIGITPTLLESLRTLTEPTPVKQSVWGEVGRIADAYNEPGLFTAFIGYEWTSTPDGNNLHRNVMFRDGSDVTSKVIPFSAIDSSDPEALWAYMADYEAQTGGAVLAIPHNGNLSNGLMFSETRLNGKALDKPYAQRRARWEPIIEVTQMKGDSETHPLLSPNDEFADYETWDKGNLFVTALKQPSMLKTEYARSALKAGLALEQRLAANPFGFGMIGSTDSHNSVATADDTNFFGKMPVMLPNKNRMHNNLMFESDDENAAGPVGWEVAASGYAAVWAAENTRESLFDAIRRKEVYATTGPRITVRLFAGWDFAPEDLYRSDFVTQGYQRGVPMGGDLPERKGQAVPTLMVSALKDPLGANLDRIQIIKGWVDNNGDTRERVYTVAASDGRAINDNQLRSVGNSVDIANATYHNDIGDSQLGIVWHDPDFNPDQPAFYYARVLEIPTPRWTTYDAKRFAVEAPDAAPRTTQQRAYTSPVWYQPTAVP